MQMKQNISISLKNLKNGLENLKDLKNFVEY